MFFFSYWASKELWLDTSFPRPITENGIHNLDECPANEYNTWLSTHERYQKGLLAPFTPSELNELWLHPYTWELDIQTQKLDSRQWKWAAYIIRSYQGVGSLVVTQEVRSFVHSNHPWYGGLFFKSELGHKPCHTCTTKFHFKHLFCSINCLSSSFLSSRKIIGCHWDLKVKYMKCQSGVDINSTWVILNY